MEKARLLCSAQATLDAQGRDCLCAKGQISGIINRATAYVKFPSKTNNLVTENPKKKQLMYCQMLRINLSIDQKPTICLYVIERVGDASICIIARYPLQ